MKQPLWMLAVYIENKTLCTYGPVPMAWDEIQQTYVAENGWKYDSPGWYKLYTSTYAYLKKEATPYPIFDHNETIMVMVDESKSYLDYILSGLNIGRSAQSIISKELYKPSVN